MPPFINRMNGILMLAPALLLSLAAPVIAATKPNIVLFVTDDQSPIAGCYGSPVIQTPHLDALAAEGTRFTQAYATTASCSASRSVILTGLHNHANGQYGHVHNYHKFETFAGCASLSLPGQLKSLGYRTVHIGKLHVAPESVYAFDRRLKIGSFASDLWAASTWQSQFEQGLSAPYGNRTVGSYIQRPAFELYDLAADPAESKNLAADPSFATQLETMKQRLQGAQAATDDPWAIKWKYE